MALAEPVTEEMELLSMADVASQLGLPPYPVGEELPEPVEASPAPAAGEEAPTEDAEAPTEAEDVEAPAPQATFGK